MNKEKSNAAVAEINPQEAIEQYLNNLIKKVDCDKSI